MCKLDDTARLHEVMRDKRECGIDPQQSLQATSQSRGICKRSKRH